MGLGGHFKWFFALAVGVGAFQAPTTYSAAYPSDVDLSGAPGGLAAAVPVVALDPVDRETISVIWRTIAPFAGETPTPGHWVCHLSISHDGGERFVEAPLDWGAPKLSHCNAPYAFYSRDGALYVGATLTAPRSPPPPSSAGSSGPRTPPQGAAVIARSDDGGARLGPTIRALSSDALDRFAPAPWVPDAAKRTPWDGARGVVDLSTGEIYVSGAYPAPPGGDSHSQRFYAASADLGRTFGVVRPFDDPAWPERWDGDLAAARGELALTYVAAATPDPGVACPCAVFAVSHDKGRSLRRSVVAPANQMDLDTLVHVPEVAADPSHAGRFAIGVVGAGRTSVSAYLSDDDGRTWRPLTATLPAGVVSASRPAVAFAPDGRLGLAWRGYHADGGYDVYIALDAGGRLGQSRRVSTATSHLAPDLVKTYASRGDFHTTLALSDQAAYVAWADARDGVDQRVYAATLPIASRAP